MFVFYIIATILVVLFALIVGINRAVVWEASRSKIYSCDVEIEIERVKNGDSYECILVLGAGVHPDGTPSNMLEDRLRGAVALYRAGVSDVILLSGDNSGDHYDEVSAMERYCLENGVPKSAIVRDDIGFSTSESAYNTVKLLGYRDVIVVTQEYHLYRAMYMIKRLGAEADGFAADYRGYSMQIKRDLREYVARCKDFFKVNISLRK